MLKNTRHGEFEAEVLRKLLYELKQNDMLEYDYSLW